MKYIKSFEELDALSMQDSDVWAVLDNNGMGRTRASSALEKMGYAVSEKLVRTWREKTTARIEEGNKNVREVLANSYHYYDPYRYGSPYTQPAVTTPMVLTTTTSPVKKAVSSAKTIVIMPDVQAPLHDVQLVEKFTRFVKDYQPTELAQVGDFTDSTEISRWVRGKKGEYAGDLRAGFQTSKRILHELREVFDGRFRIVRSNHDDRLEAYIDTCAPGLATFSDFELSIEHLAGFNEYGVEFVRDEVVELAPGWVMAHGDEGSLSPVAGKTAFGLAKNKFGVSTVCGHTHRAGMTSESTGYNGKIRSVLTGLEVGHFMDLTKADYLKKKGVAANWQQAFGILEVYGDRVYPRLITVQGGKFSVDGVEY